MVKYKLEDLEPASDAKLSYSFADGLNEAGLACGTSSEPGTVVWPAGSGTPQPLAGNLRRTTGVNAAGVVVGVTWDDKAMYATVDAAHDLTDVLGTLDSWAADINDAGVIVGGARGFGNTRPFIYDSEAGGAPVFLDQLEGDKRAFARGITPDGDVLGISMLKESVMGRGFVYQDGQVREFGRVSTAEAISTKGLVTGQRNFQGEATRAGGYPTGHAYRVDTQAGQPQFEDLGMTSRPGYAASEGFDVNTQGVVVGYCMPDYSNLPQDQQPPPLAFVHFPDSSPDAGWYDLEDVVTGAYGWQFWEAHGINENGQIVGMGHYGNHWRAFRLTRDHTSSVTIDVASWVAGYVMLFGGASKGGEGIGVTGGGKGVPIPPRDWFTTAWLEMSTEERASSLAEAERQIAAAVPDERLRLEMRETLTDVVERVERRSASSD